MVMVFTVLTSLINMTNRIKGPLLVYFASARIVTNNKMMSEVSSHEDL